MKINLRFILLLGFCFATPNQFSTVVAQEKVAEVVEDVMEEAQDDDDDDAVAEAAVFNNFGVEPKKLKAAKNFQLTQIFAVEIKDMERLLKLDKKQVLMLRVASKGSVKKQTKQWIAKSARQFGGMNGGNNGRPKKKKDEEEFVYKDADDIDSTTLQYATMNFFGGNPYANDSPLKSKFWKRTLKKVLTEEQAKTLKDHQEQLLLKKRNKYVDAFVSSMEFELRLTKKQAAEFEKLVRGPMTKKTIDVNPMYENYVLNYYASKANKKKMKALLSPNQLQKWKLYLGPSKQVGQMIENNNNNNNFVGVRGNGFWEEVAGAVNEIAREIKRALK